MLAVKELDPIPQFTAPAKLDEFLEARFSHSFQPSMQRRPADSQQVFHFLLEDLWGRGSSAWAEERGHHHDCIVPTWTSCRPARALAALKRSEVANRFLTPHASGDLANSSSQRMSSRTSTVWFTGFG